jgi:hypothetical protein
MTGTGTKEQGPLPPLLLALTVLTGLGHPGGVQRSRGLERASPYCAIHKALRAGREPGQSAGLFLRRGILPGRPGAEDAGAGGPDRRAAGHHRR